jgi:hypothetical protein
MVYFILPGRYGVDMWLYVITCDFTVSIARRFGAVMFRNDLSSLLELTGMIFASINTLLEITCIISSGTYPAYSISVS